jgi:hypothetical protein
MMGDPHERDDLEPSEPLTWAEIRRRYPDQWVAIVDIDWIDDTDEFLTARIAGVGPTRADPLVQARRFQGRFDEIGHFFTGRVRAPSHGFLMPGRINL